MVAGTVRQLLDASKFNFQVNMKVLLPSYATHVFNLDRNMADSIVAVRPKLDTVRLAERTS